MLKTILITNDPMIASDAESAGVSRIMVDLESLGKKERQQSRKTFISTHTMGDIPRIRHVLDKAELLVRINPWHAGSKSEIDAVINGGAERIMIPMITSMAEFKECASYIGGRVRILPLVETHYSMQHLAEFAAMPKVDELYIGLNDLHLSLGLTFLFEPLAMGLIDTMAEIIKAQGKPFGFGGIATMGSGELPADNILAEHVRLGSSCVILSSRFCIDVEIQNAEGRKERIVNALNKMADRYEATKKRTAGEIESARQETASIIEKIAAALRNKNAS